MRNAFFTTLFGVALAVGCGSSGSDPFTEGDGDDDPTGGMSSGGDGGSSTTGGASGTGGGPTGGVAGKGGTNTGGVSTGGVSTGGNETGGVSTGGNETGGVSTGGVSTGGIGLGGLSGSAGSGGATTTDPKCPVREPPAQGACAPAGIRCPYDLQGCRCLSVMGAACYQVDAGCFAAGGGAADRIAPPPVHYCACVATASGALGWDCAQLTL